jgi:hypothetical protein
MCPRLAIHSLVVLLLSGVAVTSLTGCSLIGYTVGRSLESNTSNTYAQNDVGTHLPVGAQVTVVTSDKTRYEGVYTGLTGLPSPQDSIAYETAREAYEPPFWTGLDQLPVWGADAAVVRGPSGQHGAAPDTLRGQFAGFGLTRTERLHYVRIRRADGSTLRVSLPTIRRLRDGPITLGGNVLTRMVRTSRSFPTVTAMFVEQADGATERIPLYAVRVVEGTKRSQARWVGFGIGLPLDLLMIAIQSALSGPYTSR